MVAQDKRWRVAPRVPEAQLARFPDLSPLIVQLLYNRGITQPHEVRAFLTEEYKEENPFRLKGMNEAVTRVRQAIRSGEPIAIYGDFDADGVTATALLVQTLRALGGLVEPYIPHRLDEGYGLNCHALHDLADRGIKVVVTVDCGVRSIKEVEYGNRLGLDIIVTDHHSVPDAGSELPPALAVINPKRADCPYPFKELAGVGVAFKLAQGLLRANRRVPIHEPEPFDRVYPEPCPERGRRRSRGAPFDFAQGRQDRPIKEADLLDLVALGTVTDLSPLQGENRALVKKGLEVLNSAQRVGLAALMAQAGVKPGEIDTHTISYVLGPRLNAAGRLAHAMTSYKLLMTSSLDEAAPLAQELDEKNRLRQELTLQTLEKAREQVMDQLPEGKLLFAIGKEYPAGIVGLVASRLTEEFYRPSVVVELGPERSRGSARSISEFNIIAALDECGHLLLKYGGHSMAAGFTVANDDLEALYAQLSQIAARQLQDVELVPSLEIDAEVSLNELDWASHTLLEQLAPFGQANPMPLLMSRGVMVRDSRIVGDDHLKLTLDDGRIVWDAIAFHLSDRAESLPQHIDIVYALEVHEWADEKRLQLNVKDLRPTG